MENKHFLRMKGKCNMKLINKFNLFLTPFILTCFVVIVGCSGCIKSTIPTNVPEVLPGILQGYLPLKASPNADALLPAPPARDSAAFAADQDAFHKTRALKNTPRWALASKDAILKFPQAAEVFSCALNLSITEEATPNLYMILRRSLSDAGYATGAPKSHYGRIRPFVLNNETSCAPADEPVLSKEGSYPSGHTSIGWTWALILAEIAPERADAIFKRGYAFGQSRIICGAHWQSDVEAGRVVAAAVVAKLHSDPVFRAQLKAAKKEIAEARAKGIGSMNDCNAEAAALAY